VQPGGKKHQAGGGQEVNNWGAKKNLGRGGFNSNRGREAPSKRARTV